MFENFPHKPLFGANLVSKLFAEDTRDDKLDLGLGVYKSSEGQTTILGSVKKAEARLLKGQKTKSYRYPLCSLRKLVPHPENTRHYRSTHYFLAGTKN